MGPERASELPGRRNGLISLVAPGPVLLFWDHDEERFVGPACCGPKRPP